ncbi:LLM class flavin-dependent oxidoreductase [Thermomonospora umbrina]|uniref:Alkanesulfonate monooxygenase SsuD/methylene tetrahydromethanopterin reductase-like flavin-dependent oxidoreductase (Luciferase family) n=1 Tax=Thermomonospora umbrina TaxID=111806 RepID=A0A3D9SW22_9ACTN|nr:LLM class flavin-dependent oxidoreductase [Thermomonospora umbrina]REF00133.1 alkanesulfonate monooxygenase SsuD/methylene tetrahydromethanopterin reductase-like flavin-dependent oxidoreductase (luciferase family) [Thermomonospora umbrina]
MRLGVMMWPIRSWAESRDLWARAEELGFDHGWVADHLAWRGHTPWFDGYSTLTAAATVTSTMRLGTLVTSPNFRHPVPAAHALRALDDISGGRLTVGIGAGGVARTSDAGVLGDDWTPGERAGRFAEWVTLLDRLLRGPETTYEGAYYSAREVVTAPGCVQRPRPPFAVAANGPRGMRLAARLADIWVTNAITPGAEGPEETVRSLHTRLGAACEAEERDPSTLRRLLLTGFTDEPWLESPAAFEDLAGRYAALGITDLVVHWPRPGTAWDADPTVFETIARTHGG